MREKASVLFLKRERPSGVTDSDGQYAVVVRREGIYRSPLLVFLSPLSFAHLVVVFPYISRDINCSLIWHIACCAELVSFKAS